MVYSSNYGTTNTLIFFGENVNTIQQTMELWFATEKTLYGTMPKTTKLHWKLTKG